jgi:hypothetical protein
VRFSSPSPPVATGAAGHGAHHSRLASGCHPRAARHGSRTPKSPAASQPAPGRSAPSSAHDQSPSRLPLVNVLGGAVRTTRSALRFLSAGHQVYSVSSALSRASGNSCSGAHRSGFQVPTPGQKVAPGLPSARELYARLWSLSRRMRDEYRKPVRMRHRRPSQRRSGWFPYPGISL